MGATLPIGYANLESQLLGPAGTMDVDSSEAGLGDVLLLPASFYWYDVNDNVNIYRNYWSFDTVFAVTNLNEPTGRDFSPVAGYMINTENDATNYKTGHELNVDMMFNQFFSDAFALALHGYYYQQMTGDSASGAILGDFKGKPYGIRPSFSWIPKSGGGKFSVTDTWLHDLHATDRLEGDYAIVTLA